MWQSGPHNLLDNPTGVSVPTYSHMVPEVYGNYVKLINPDHLFIVEIEVLGDCLPADLEVARDLRLDCSNNDVPCYIYDLNSTSTRSLLTFKIRTTFSTGYQFLSSMVTL